MRSYMMWVLTYLDVGAVVSVLCRQRSWECVGLRLLVLLLTGPVAVWVTLFLGKPSSPAVTVQLQVHSCVPVSFMILHVCEGGAWREGKTHVMGLYPDFNVLHDYINPNMENIFNCNGFELMGNSRCNIPIKKFQGSLRTNTHVLRWPNHRD